MLLKTKQNQIMKINATTVTLKNILPTGSQAKVYSMITFIQNNNSLNYNDRRTTVVVQEG